MFARFFSRKMLTKQNKFTKFVYTNNLLMKFKIALNINRKYGDLLPFNYQYEQSAVIYRILAQADTQYASWLHENGYLLNGSKRFKLFCYPPFIFDKVRPLPEAGCLDIIGERAVWYISFIPEKSTFEFFKGLFDHKSFTIGNKEHRVAFDVVEVEAIPMPQLSEEMVFQALSPICVKLHEDNKTQYLSPDNPMFAEGILKGLLARYESIHGQPFDMENKEFSFKLTDKKVKSKLITIKANTPYESRVRGYLCAFRLKAPLELMKIAYEGGVGEQCSQGFGFIEIKKETI